MKKNHKSTLAPPSPQGHKNSSPKHVLIVDDEAGMRHSLQRLLAPTGYEVCAVKSDKEALSSVGETAFDVVIMDVQISGVAGLNTLRSVREIDPKLPVVIITAYGTAELAIQAMQMGAYDYILKPFDVPLLKAVIDHAADVGRLNRTRVTIDPPPVIDPLEDRIVGINPGMQEVYKQIGQVAATDVPLLIRGETGTGKELVARAVYQHSRRVDLPFMAINCAAIPEGLLESELFGHERGAFTSAFNRRIGKFEQAHRGTIFLDEIGDMALSTQAKILRVLQDGIFQRLGGSEDIKVDVRVLAATHRNLEEDVEEGLFREDLYYRLNVVSVVLPPLKERKDDLPRLIDYFMNRFCAEMKIERVAISLEAMERLIRHDWPGNIRELQNCLKNAILTCRGGVTITANDIHLPETPSADAEGQPVFAPDAPRMRQTQDVRLPKKPPPPSDNGPFLSELDDAWLDTLGGNLHTVVSSETERRLILYALERCDNNQVHTAELLGISRSMLRDRLKRYKRAESDKGALNPAGK